MQEPKAIPTPLPLTKSPSRLARSTPALRRLSLRVRMLSLSSLRSPDLMVRGRSMSTILSTPNTVHTVTSRLLTRRKVTMPPFSPLTRLESTTAPTFSSLPFVPRMNDVLVATKENRIVDLQAGLAAAPTAALRACISATSKTSSPLRWMM